MVVDVDRGILELDTNEIRTHVVAGAARVAANIQISLQACLRTVNSKQ